MAKPPPTGEIWTHGCDACQAAAPVEYVPPLGYLCAFCRRPESLEDLRREIQHGTRRRRAPPVGEMTFTQLTEAAKYYETLPDKLTDKQRDRLDEINHRLRWLEKEG